MINEDQVELFAAWRFRELMAADSGKKYGEENDQ